MASEWNNFHQIKNFLHCFSAFIFSLCELNCSKISFRRTIVLQDYLEWLFSAPSYTIHKKNFQSFLNFKDLFFFYEQLKCTSQFFLKVKVIYIKVSKSTVRCQRQNQNIWKNTFYLPNLWTENVILNQMSKLKLCNLENKMIEIEGRTLYSYLYIVFCFVQFYLFCCCCLLICFLRFYVMLFENSILKQSLQMYSQQFALKCCQPDGFSYKGGLIIHYYSCSLTIQCFSVHELFIKHPSVFRQNHSNLSASFSSSFSCSILAMHAHAQKCVVQLE